MTNEQIQKFMQDCRKDMEDDQLWEEIELLVKSRLSGAYVPIGEQVEIIRQIFNSIRGGGLLETILSDDGISEVMINGLEEK